MCTSTQCFRDSVSNATEDILFGFSLEPWPVMQIVNANEDRFHRSGGGGCEVSGPAANAMIKVCYVLHQWPGICLTRQPRKCLGLLNPPLIAVQIHSLQFKYTKCPYPKCPVYNDWGVVGDGFRFSFSTSPVILVLLVNLLSLSPVILVAGGRSTAFQY